MMGTSRLAAGVGVADVVFNDVEQALRDWLATRLKVPVYTATTPAGLPPASVTITRVGGQVRDQVIDTPRLSIDCRSAARPGAAAELALKVRGLLLGDLRTTGPGLALPVYDVEEQTGPYLNPDPRNPSQSRYTLIITVTMRATTIPTL